LFLTQQHHSAVPKQVEILHIFYRPTLLRSSIQRPGRQLLLRSSGTQKPQRAGVCPNLADPRAFGQRQWQHGSSIQPVAGDRHAQHAPAVLRLVQGIEGFTMGGKGADPTFRCNLSQGDKRSVWFYAHQAAAKQRVQFST